MPAADEKWQSLEVTGPDAVLFQWAFQSFPLITSRRKAKQLVMQKDLLVNNESVAYYMYVVEGDVVRLREAAVSAPSNEQRELVCDEDGVRLEPWAMRNFSKLTSRRIAHRCLKRGELSVNGSPAEGSRVLHVGDCVTLCFDAKAELIDSQRSVADSVRVLYEDEAVAVLAKPAGLDTNGPHPLTLEKTAACLLRPSSRNDGIAPAPVHRLDKATTGLVVCAKTVTAREALWTAFSQKGDVRKLYRAAVAGEVPRSGGAGDGWDFQLEATLDGQTALTKGRLLKDLGNVKLLELWPVTGRKHQLRKHLSLAGCPILGDKLYGSRGAAPGRHLHLAALEVSFFLEGHRHTVSMEPPAFLELREGAAEGAED